MLSETKKRALSVACSNSGTHLHCGCVESSKSELRRLMYERIQQGNALSEIEHEANHTWRNK